MLSRAPPTRCCWARSAVRKYDTLPREMRPEQGILGIRRELGLFANLRPALAYPELAGASTLKPEVIAGLDIVIVRELTGDVYFGQPRGRRTNAAGEDEGFDTMLYSVSEIARIARVGFETARRRGKRLCSVDKANVLDTSILWREVVTAMGEDYPDVALSHMYVDNAAMQLVRNPKQFDVIVTGNLFGDILSDEASMLAGSIGMLPSASLDGAGKGLYEPIHGSAPDIAGQDRANPLATILSLAMMFRFTFARADVADRIEAAVRAVLKSGQRTRDIALPGESAIGTRAMGDAVVAALQHTGVNRARIQSYARSSAGVAASNPLRAARRGRRHARGRARSAARRKSRRSRRPDRSPRPAVASASGPGGGQERGGSGLQGERNASRFRRLARNGRIGAHAADAGGARFRSHRIRSSSPRRTSAARAPRSARTRPRSSRRTISRRSRRRTRSSRARAATTPTTSIRSCAPPAGTATGSTPHRRCAWPTTP